MSRWELMLGAVQRGKYAKLYRYLTNMPGSKWETSFSEIERILEFPLPKSARIYRPWWANQDNAGHSQSMAWMVAGWKTAEVDLDGETLTFRRDGDLPAPVEPAAADPVYRPAEAQALFLTEEPGTTDGRVEFDPREEFESDGDRDPPDTGRDAYRRALETRRSALMATQPAPIRKEGD